MASTFHNDRSGKPTGSQCQRASINAYKQLRACGETDRAAFRASVWLYRYHHPECSKPDAVHTVATWLDEALDDSHS